MEVNEPIDVESCDNQEIQSVVESTKKKAKTETSDCWKFFTKIGVADDGIERAKCIGCNQEYKVGGKNYGTSHLKRHILKCKNIKFEDVGQMMIDMQGKLKSQKIDQMVSREMCALAIIEHDLPFNFVEYERIRMWVSYLNPDAIPITRNTAKSDVLKIYMREKENLKDIMASIPTRICLTSDLWTTCNTEGYICLTAHFVDRNWNLNSKILNFCHMPPPHTGFELCQKNFDLLKDWGIEKKLFSITLDNASANDNMVRNLKSQLGLQKLLLCDGQFFHVRCSAHILNLIVQEGLKVSSDALSKIRESVKYLRGSEGRMKAFKECIDQVGGINTSKGLCLDVPTRWNSTYLMLESALIYRRVFSILELSDKNYKYCPTLDEWDRGEKIMGFLKPFYDITELISGTSYPTANLYFLQVWQIQCSLQNTLHDEDDILKSMAARMMEKFDKYWEEYSIVLALGALLDPQMKTSALSYCYSKVNPLTSEAKVEEIKKNAYNLFDNYACHIPPSSNALSQSLCDVTSASSSGSISIEKKGFSEIMFQELKKHNQPFNAAKIGKSQLDVYLGEENLEFDDDTFDILQWWKGRAKRLPNLSLMARDLLSIPITTVASESAFSIGSRILNKYRSSLLPECVEALLCTRNWQNRFSGTDEGASDEKIDEKIDK